MSSSERKKLAALSVVVGYMSMAGMVAWRILRGRQLPAGPAPAPLPGAKLLPPPVERETLESLSLQAPSEAALDRLARRAAFEEQESAIMMPGGGVADVKAAAPEGPGRPWHNTDPVVYNLLRCQSLETVRLTGWSLPEPVRVPVPTFAPAVLAMGIVIFAMGIATSFYVCVAGAIIFAIAAWRWTGILQGSELHGD